jgi:hypothetical protein
VEVPVEAPENEVVPDETALPEDPTTLPDVPDPDEAPDALLPPSTAGPMVVTPLGVPITALVSACVYSSYVSNLSVPVGAPPHADAVMTAIAKMATRHLSARRRAASKRLAFILPSYDDKHCGHPRTVQSAHPRAAVVLRAFTTELRRSATIAP